MSLLDEFRDALLPVSEISGRVVSVSRDRVVVATKSGAVEATRGGMMVVGDTVTVRDRVAVKEKRALDRVYWV